MKFYYAGQVIAILFVVRFGLSVEENRTEVEQNGNDSDNKNPYNNLEPTTPIFYNATLNMTARIFETITASPMNMSGNTSNPNFHGMNGTASSEENATSHNTNVTISPTSATSFQTDDYGGSSINSSSVEDTTSNPTGRNTSIVNTSTQNSQNTNATHVTGSPSTGIENSSSVEVQSSSPTDVWNSNFTQGQNQFTGTSGMPSNETSGTQTEPPILLCYDVTCHEEGCLEGMAENKTDTCTTTSHASCYIERSTSTNGNVTTVTIKAGCSDARCSSSAAMSRYCCNLEKCNKNEGKVPEENDRNSAQFFTPNSILVAILTVFGHVIRCSARLLMT